MINADDDEAVLDKKKKMIIKLEARSHRTRPDRHPAANLLPLKLPHHQRHQITRDRDFLVEGPLRQLVTFSSFNNDVLAVHPAAPVVRGRAHQHGCPSRCSNFSRIRKLHRGRVLARQQRPLVDRLALREQKWLLPSSFSLFGHVPVDGVTPGSGRVVDCHLARLSR